MIFGAAPSSFTLRMNAGNRTSTKIKLRVSIVDADDPTESIQARHCDGIMKNHLC